MIAYLDWWIINAKSIFVYESFSGKKSIQWHILRWCDFACFRMRSGKYLYYLAQYWFWIGIPVGSTWVATVIQSTRHFIFTVFTTRWSLPSLLLKVMRKQKRLQEKKEKKRQKQLYWLTITEAGHPQKRIVAIDIPTRNYFRLANAPENQNLLHGSCFRMKNYAEKIWFWSKRKSEGISSKSDSKWSFQTTVNPLYSTNQEITWGIPRKLHGKQVRKVLWWGLWRKHCIDWKVESRPPIGAPPERRNGSRIYREGWKDIRRDFLYVAEVTGGTLELKSTNGTKPCGASVREHRTDMKLHHWQSPVVKSLWALAHSGREISPGHRSCCRLVYWEADFELEWKLQNQETLL